MIPSIKAESYIYHESLLVIILIIHWILLYLEHPLYNHALPYNTVDRQLGC